MITLSEIRDLVLNQEKELEELLYQYLSQNNIDNNRNKNKITDQELKKNIEKQITQGNLEQASILLQQYKDTFGEDVSTYSIQGVINLNENNMDSALDNFIKGLKIDNTDVDLLYNMAYLNLIVGNKEEAIDYYEACLKYTNEKELIKEIYNTLNSIKLDVKSCTLITFGLSTEEAKVLLGKNKVINIIEKEDISYENKYEENGVTIYQVNPSQTSYIVDYLTRRNENSIIILRDIYKLDKLSKFKESSRIVYYPTKNYYTDKTNYLNHSIDMFSEKNVCNNVDFIITDDINVYNSKKIIERRNNVYLLKEDIGEIFTIDNILNNFENINQELINKYLKEYIKSLEDEYEKLLYLIASENSNLQNCIELCKYINEKYKMEEIYQLYVSLLNEAKEYNTLAATIINSEYCDDIFKAEIVYLSAIQNYDLIRFIIDISIKNYTLVEKISSGEIDYKMALYNFELNNFDKSLNIYIDLLNSNSNTINSPLVNRNTGYLLYASGNDSYETYYDNYKNIMESFFETDEE